MALLQKSRKRVLTTPFGRYDTKIPLIEEGQMNVSADIMSILYL